jgi:iron complex transport system permease protein
MVLATFLALVFGSVEINFFELMRCFASSDSDSACFIMRDVRLPRVILGGFVGASLSIAGVISQGLFKNPLAAPSVIGTEAGASMGIALAVLLGWSHSGVYALPVFALIGATLTTFLVISSTALYHRVSTPMILLIGFALNAMFAAFTSLIVSYTLEQNPNQTSLLTWLYGSLNAKGYEHLSIVLIAFAVGLAICFTQTKKLDLLTLGEDIAQTMNVSITHLRIVCILAIGILTAAPTAVAGGLPFVGLIVPHITRQLLGPSHRQLVIFSAINGWTIIVFTDLIARTIIAPSELNLGTLVAVIGTPFLVWALLRSHK